MASRKTKKLRRKVKKRQEYLKTFESRINKGDRTTPSYAQWSKASSYEKGQMAAGVHKPIGVSLARSYVRGK